MNTRPTRKNARRLAVHLDGEDRELFDHVDAGGTFTAFAAAHRMTHATVRQRHTRLVARLAGSDCLVAAEVLDDLPPDLRPLLLEMGLRNKSARQTAAILGRTEKWCDRTYRMLRLALRVVLKRELRRSQTACADEPFDG